MSEADGKSKPVVVSLVVACVLIMSMEGGRVGLGPQSPQEGLWA